MLKHTIVFKTGQLLLPEKTDRDFVADLLHVGQLQLDFIGGAGEQRTKHADEVSLLTFHLDTEEKLDYSMQESEISHLLSELLKKRIPQ